MKNIRLGATGQKSGPYIEEEFNNSIVNWLMAKKAEKPKKKKKKKIKNNINISLLKDAKNYRASLGVPGSKSYLGCLMSIQIFPLLQYKILN